MKTIQVSKGDIQLKSGQLQFVVGTEKLAQDIALWLKEPLGTGYTSPGFGSTLLSMVGGNQSNNNIAGIQNEIVRVLQLYQGQQIINLQNAQNSAQLSYWNKNEIIKSINSVSINLQNSSVLANVSLTTLANNTINLNVLINNNGVSVNNG